MPTIADKTPMTMEEFLALPDDGIERDLIDGVVRVWSQVKDDPMTRRNRMHCRVMFRLAQAIAAWSESPSGPGGAIYVGEVDCRLQPGATGIGIDVAYLSAEQLSRQTDETTLIEGPPTLAAEILLPSNTQDEIDGKIKAYLSAGVPVVWVVNPTFRTVTAYCSDAAPGLFNIHDELTAEPHLPGFRAAVADLFRS